jgi:hypothetical protein
MEADEYFRTAIRVTSDLRHKLTKKLNSMRIPWIVAPREADPQLAFMVSSRCPLDWRCDMIITEDSDLVVYCVAGHIKAPVMLKLRTSGTCDVVDVGEIYVGYRAARQNQRSDDDKEKKKNKLSGSKLFMSRLLSMTPRMFVQMCCMSGTDYTTRISNNGMMRSQELICRFASSNSEKRFEDVLYYLRHPNENDGNDDSIVEKEEEENKKPSFSKKKKKRKSVAVRKKKKKKKKTPAIIAENHLTRLQCAEYAFFKAWCYEPVSKQTIPFVQNALYDLPSLPQDVNVDDVIGTVVLFERGVGESLSLSLPLYTTPPISRTNHRYDSK